MTNREYAAILSQVASLRAVAGANRFQIAAFSNAARAIKGLAQPIDDLVVAGKVLDVPGVGKGIAAELEAMYQTGCSPALQGLLEVFPESLLAVLAVPGLGPKRVKVLYEDLGVANLDDLRAVAESGALAELPGLGKKTQAKILAELEHVAENAARTPLPLAREIAQDIADELLALPAVERCQVAGSIRRGLVTVGDIDIIATSSDSETVFDHLVSMRRVRSVIARGPTKTSVRLRGGMQVDVRVVADHQFGAALHYFTGSREHHILLRARAKKAGLKVNEYGVFRRDSDEKPIAGATEADVYASLGLAFVPPELREGRDELELAAADRLPALLQPGDVLGDSHMHTLASDGRDSIEGMAARAIELGYKWIAITDHSQALVIANGMDEERFRRQLDRVREVDAATPSLRILAGIEVDILSDGALDMAPDLLADADWVVGSIHTQFRQPLEQMTQRIVDAIDTGLLSSLGHPTGRRLGQRRGYEFDWQTVIDAAVSKRVAFELNGGAGRIDLDAESARRVRSAGAMVVLGSDAHSAGGLHVMSNAVQQARRAGFEACDVLNTLDADTLLARVR